jgi:hypothetical protein
MTRIPASLLLALAVAACADRATPVRLVPGQRLRLESAPGVRINARLAPALELADGTVLRFSASHVTPDSSYFAEAPTAAAPAGDVRRGTLRVSVCAEAERLCQLVTLGVVW